uniref:VPS37 C-terminal domain-containing protein n=2 Tax=Timema TaxID=61471 RepID=A0A7R9H9X5_TIMPO|nr:unnamed protein product [Timema douglasi]CAD7411632.1 unnamed protein product [Timema poppensis]
MYSNYPKEPDYPAALGLLSHLNVEELKEMLNNDAKFDEMIKDVKQFKELETEKEMLMASNRSLAEFNLSKEPLLRNGKMQLKDLSQEGEKLYQSVEDKLSLIKQKTGNTNLETTLALIQTSAAESEENSEAIAEKFLDGDMELDSFLDQFITSRKVMHLRRVKSDKMTEMVTARMRAPVLQPNSMSHSGQSFFTAPYPIGGQNMPMPPHYGVNMY